MFSWYFTSIATKPRSPDAVRYTRNRSNALPVSRKAGSQRTGERSKRTSRTRSTSRGRSRPATRVAAPRSRATSPYPMKHCGWLESRCPASTFARGSAQGPSAYSAANQVIAGVSKLPEIRAAGNASREPNLVRRRSRRWASRAPPSTTPRVGAPVAGIWSRQTTTCRRGVAAQALATWPPGSSVSPGRAARCHLETHP